MSKILLILVVILIIVGALYFEKRRSSDMQAVANRLGLSFHPGQHRLPETLEGAGFDLFTQGPPNIKNRMQGERNGRSVSLFDFTYTATSSGEGQRELPPTDEHHGLESRSQSVIWLRSDRALPDFDLAPSRTHRRNVASRFGFNRVTFDGRNDFNQEYVLLARDAEKMRTIFSDDVIRFLLANPGQVIESRGRESLFYRFENLSTPKAIPAFLRETEELLGLLQRPQP